MYPNIHMRNMNLWRYSIGTPINEWMKTNQLFESNYLFEHIADIFRMVTLHKFGGYCMDLDVVVQKNIDDLGENFIGNDWGSVVNTAFLHLNNHGIGKRILQQYFRQVCYKFFFKKFDQSIMVVHMIISGELYNILMEQILLPMVHRHWHTFLKTFVRKQTELCGHKSSALVLQSTQKSISIQSHGQTIQCSLIPRTWTKLSNWWKTHI